MSVPAAVFNPRRLEAVRATGLMDTPAEAAFDRLAEMAGTLLDAPFAFVTLVDSERSFWKSCVSIGDAPAVEARQNTVEESFCQYVVGAGERLIVGDTRADPRTRDNPSIEAMGVEAWAGYPVFGPTGAVLGTFCVVDTRTREWTARDEWLLETLSESASREIALRMAVDAEREARLAADELARSLQATLLPPTLPAVPGVTIAARYAPAGGGTEVVGDFYDVFDLGGGCWGLAIGDVCGKGVEAAKVTALARHTIRAAARTDDQPARVLAELNAALRGADLPEAFFLSAQFGTLRPVADGVDIELSSAGHPYPWLRRAGGAVEEVAARGVLLGIADAPELETVGLRLGAGDTLVLYTDGVSEARGRRGVLGDERLRELIASAAPEAARLIEHVEQAVREHTDGPLADDIALLAVQPQADR